MKQTSFVLESFAATVVSTASAFSGEMLMAWIILGINAATLISNALLAIYKKWKHRDDDDEKGGDNK